MCKKLIFLFSMAIVAAVFLWVLVGLGKSYDVAETLSLLPPQSGLSGTWTKVNGDMRTIADSNIPPPGAMVLAKNLRGGSNDCNGSGIVCHGLVACPFPTFLGVTARITAPAAAIMLI